MDDHGWLPTVVPIGLVLILVLLGRMLRKSTQEDTTSHAFAPATRARRSIGLLCTFACAVGAIWLVPWATFLPLTDISGLLPGIVFIVLLSMGVLGALQDLGTGN
jgi:hypothetical protein